MEQMPSTPQMWGVNSRNVPATPPPADLPVAPLPPVVGEPDPGPGDVPVVPLPPAGSTPPVDSGDVPVIPLPPIGSTPPVDSGDVPVIPLPPIGGTPPVDPGPGPVIPGPILPLPGYCTVRFLHAVFDGEPIRITIGRRVVASNLEFGGLTPYYRVADGFRTVTVYSVRNPWTILYQASVPMSAGEVITLAVVRSGARLDLVRVSDAPCTSRPRNTACIRAINLVYNSPPLDLVLRNGRVIFTDVRYQEVTMFKQARAREYDFYIAQTPYTLAPSYSDIAAVEDMPLAIANFYLPGYGSVEPLVSFYVDAKPGAMESIYILGNWNLSRVVRTKVVENF